MPKNSHRHVEEDAWAVCWAISPPVLALRKIGVLRWFLFGCLTVISAELVEARPTNVIFFITDDQFKEDMNFLPEGKGKNLTPNTDRLAAEGAVMTQQYVVSPVCTPSRFSCLTGLYPSRSTCQSFLRETSQHGGQTVVQWNTFLTPKEQSLPERFRKAGYFTGIVGKNHVIDTPDWKKPQWNGDPNSKEAKELLERNRQVQAKAAQSVGFDFAGSLYFNNPMENGMKALACHNLDWIAEGARNFLQQAGDRPFFLYLATTVPHGPQEPDRSWKADRRITANGLLPEPLAWLGTPASLEQRLQKAGLAGKKRENNLWLDDLFGFVVKELEARGELTNTIILYFNDHGQKSKGTVYEGGVHGESFVWRQGGFPVGHTCDAFVSNADFAPTLLDLCKIDYEAKDFDGHSFAPQLMGQPGDSEKSMYFELGFVRGIRQGPWKYIALRYPKNIKEMSLEERRQALEEFNQEQEKKGRPVYTQDPTQSFSHISAIPGGGDAEHLSMGKYPGFYDQDQLYNVAEDANEQKNLAADPSQSSRLGKMKAELTKVLGCLPGTFGELKPAAKSAGSP
jgi:arylsulfatase A-like enzyme